MALALAEGRGLRGAWADLVAFHETMGQPIVPRPSIPSPSRRTLRCRLIREEVVEELLPALEADDLEGIADGLADSIVVIIGTALEYGIDLRRIWDEVHRTNMAKASGPRREDGKVLKPAGWQPPRIAELLASQEAIR